MWGLFPGTPSRPDQSNKVRQHTEFVTTHWPTNINVVPIDYAFLPRLRDRLTLRRLTLRRNPWTFGDSVSHTVCRYSCQHSHFRYLHPPSRAELHRPTERSATAQWSGVSGQETPDLAAVEPAGLAACAPLPQRKHARRRPVRLMRSRGLRHTDTRA